MSAPRRRTVIAGVAAAAATVTTTVGSATTAHAAKAPTDLIRRSRFTPHVGMTFTMMSPAGRWSVTLDAVGDLTAGAVSGAEKQFTAVFSGTGPGDGVYTFARKGFTATALFVVAGSDSGVATVNCV